MDYEQIKKEFGIEIFKLNNLNRTNYVLYIYKNREFHKELSISNLMDIVRDKFTDVFFKYFYTNYNEEIGNKLNKINKLTLIIQEGDRVFFPFKQFVEIIKTNIEGYTFCPNNQLIINNKINLYEPTNKNFNLPANINSKDKFPHIKFLMENILQNSYENFIKWLGWKLQNPLKVVSTQWIIQDDGGTGKTEFLNDYILSNLFNCVTAGQEALQSTFNEYLQNVTMVIFEEIEGFEDYKKIKMLTGAKSHWINAKNKAPYPIPNYVNFIFFSNDIKSLKIDLSDRRFNVTGGGKRLIATDKIGWDKCLFKSQEENSKFTKAYYKNREEELKHLYQYLMALKVDVEEVQQIYFTEYRKDLQESNMTSEQTFLLEIYQDGINNVIEEYCKNSNNFLKQLIYINNEHIIDTHFISCKNLHALYLFYCDENGLTKKISKHHLIRRLKTSPIYNEIFGDVKLIWVINKPIKCIELKKYKDENKNIKINITGENGR